MCKILIIYLSALELPAYWEPMHEGSFKKVELQPTSSEYKNIAQGFLQTAKYNIHKVSMMTQKKVSHNRPFELFKFYYVHLLLQ